MRLILGKNVYQVVAVLPNGRVRLRHHKSKKYQTVSEETILQAAVTQEIKGLLSETSSHSNVPRNKRSTRQHISALSVCFTRLDLTVHESKQIL